MRLHDKYSFVQSIESLPLILSCMAEQSYAVMAACSAAGTQLEWILTFQTAAETALTYSHA